MLRFTIRELLILTVTAGLVVGWWLDRLRLESGLASAAEKLDIAAEENERLRLKFRWVEEIYEEETGNTLTVTHNDSLLTRD